MIISLCVANIEGRIFMNSLDCPFRAMEEFLEAEAADAGYRRFSRGGDIREDSHGMVPRWQGGALMGTHTHVQTADDRVLPKAPGILPMQA